MEVSHTWNVSESAALRQLGQFVRARQGAWQSGTPSYERFEQEVHEQVMALERELLESLRRNFAGKTLIAITHRPLLASVADQVLTIDQGSIVESGVTA